MGKKDNNIHSPTRRRTKADSSLCPSEFSSCVALYRRWVHQEGETCPFDRVVYFSCAWARECIHVFARTDGAIAAAINSSGGDDDIAPAHFCSFESGSNGAATYTYTCCVPHRLTKSHHAQVLLVTDRVGVGASQRTRQW